MRAGAGPLPEGVADAALLALTTVPVFLALKERRSIGLGDCLPSRMRNMIY